MLLEVFKKNKQFSFRYYRNQLSSFEQQVYDKIYNGIMSYSERIELNVPFSQRIADIYYKVLNDNPEIFFVKPFSYSNTTIFPVYRFDMATTEKHFRGLADKSLKIIGKKNRSELDREKNIHDYFCSRTLYDQEYCDYIEANNGMIPFSKSGSECAGPLLFGKGVCGGIAKAAKLLFDLAGIKSIYVVSKTHAWNIVYIKNIPYHLDITWDLSHTKSCGILRYDYFNLSDVEILLEGEEHHPIDLEKPLCRISGNYYRQNNMYMLKQDDFRRYLTNSLKNGKKTVVFKLPCVKNKESAKSHVIDIVNDVSKRIYGACQYQYYFNEKQYVFCLRFL